MTTNEHRISLYFSQDHSKPVLEYFDPLVFLREIPVFLSQEIIDIICENYMEKIRRMTLLDLFFLSKLSIETVVVNPIFEHLFNKAECKKRLRIISIVKDSFNAPEMTAVDYFTQYPYGQIEYLGLKN
jgi:hypothetical protein